MCKEVVSTLKGSERTKLFCISSSTLYLLPYSYSNKSVMDYDMQITPGLFDQLILFNRIYHKLIRLRQGQSYFNLQDSIDISIFISMNRVDRIKLRNNDNLGLGFERFYFKMPMLRNKTKFGNKVGLSRYCRFPTASTWLKDTLLQRQKETKNPGPVGFRTHDY